MTDHDTVEGRKPAVLVDGWSTNFFVRTRQPSSIKPSGVWSFRTRTGIARVVNGRLRVRHTPRGLVHGVWHAGRESWVQVLIVGGGFVGVVSPLRQVAQAVLVEQSLAAAMSAVVSLLLTLSIFAVPGMILWSTLSKSPTVPVYNINRVTVDDTELTVTYETVDGEHETTLDARDEEALDEAVEVLQLKGAPVEVD